MYPSKYRSSSYSSLLATAKAVLAENQTPAFTKPSPRQYPHQWNWDAGFIAIGYAHYDQARAEQELRFLFESQWTNGLLPHIVFQPEGLDGYFPDPTFWQTDCAICAPGHVATSGLTNPPVHASAALHLYRYGADRTRARAFLKELYPKILAQHRYLYKHRDPNREGLVYISHPWESGTDNAPTWDDALARIDLEAFPVPPYRRKDLNNVCAEQRPTNAHYDRFMLLIDVHRRHAYDDAAIAEGCPFLIQDPLFNGLLCKANEDLVEIATILGEDPAEARAWHNTTRNALNARLWDPVRGVYDAFDLRLGTRIPMHGISGFIPLAGGAPSADQAEHLVRAIFTHLGTGGAREHFFIPSYSTGGQAFQPTNYWRGPVWINTNWLIYHGLRRYGYHAEAEAVLQDMLTLITRHGFYEYFTPYRHQPASQPGGYGTGTFSWTAALCIDLLHREDVAALLPEPIAA